MVAGDCCHVDTGTLTPYSTTTCPLSNSSDNSLKLTNCKNAQCRILHDEDPQRTITVNSDIQHLGVETGRYPSYYREPSSILCNTGTVKLLKMMKKPVAPRKTFLTLFSATATWPENTLGLGYGNYGLQGLRFQNVSDLVCLGVARDFGQDVWSFSRKTSKFMTSG